jgi:hypothetical protein
MCNQINILQIEIENHKNKSEADGNGAAEHLCRLNQITKYFLPRVGLDEYHYECLIWTNMY